MEGHKNYAGQKYKDWRKPRNKNSIGLPYRPPLESNGRDFKKSALYALEKRDKSLFSMSGHVDPLDI